MAIDGSVTLGVADGAYPALSADGLAGNTGDASVALTGTSFFPRASATAATGEQGDGDANLGDVDNFQSPATPLALASALLAEHVFGGAVEFTQYDLADGSLEPPPELPLIDVIDALVLSGAVAVGAAAAPPWESAGAVLTGAIGAGAVQLDPPVATGDTGPGADIVVPALELEALAQAGTVATAAATLAPPQLDAAGLAQGVGSGAAVLPQAALAATARATARSDGAVLLAAPALAALLLAGSRGTGAVMMAPWRAAGAARADNSGSGAVRLAVPAVEGQLAPRAAALYRMLVLNPRTRAVTEYAGIAANSVAFYNGVVLAATADGIMALTGDTDNGAPIAASMTSGRLDFESDHHKRLTAGYAGYRASGPLTLSLAADGGAATRYTLTPRGAGLHPTRTLFGRGAKGRYWQWTLANTGGAAFAVDALGFDADVLARRV